MLSSQNWPRIDIFTPFDSVEPDERAGAAKHPFAAQATTTNRRCDDFIVARSKGQLIQLASFCSAHLVVIFFRLLQNSTAAGPVISP